MFKWCSGATRSPVCCLAPRHGNLTSLASRSLAFALLASPVRAPDLGNGEQVGSAPSCTALSRGPSQSALGPSACQVLQMRGCVISSFLKPDCQMLK